jgi:hypothetical protein
MHTRELHVPEDYRFLVSTKSVLLQVGAFGFHAERNVRQPACSGQAAAASAGLIGAPRDCRGAAVGQPPLALRKVESTPLSYLPKLALSESCGTAMA